MEENITKQPYMSNQEYRIIGNLNVSDRIMKNSFWVGIYPGLQKTLKICIKNFRKLLTF